MLTHYTTIYFPDKFRLAEYFAAEASRVAGGATMTDGLGAWVNDEGVLVLEEVRTVKVWHTPDQDHDLGMLARQYAHNLFVLGEHTVMIETEAGATMWTDEYNINAASLRLGEDFQPTYETGWKGD